MKVSFGLLAGANLLLMVVTAAVGLRVDGETGFARHFLLGVLTGMFTCFVHIVLFMYFVVQAKIVSQSVLQRDIDASYEGRIQGLKSRALRLSLIGIGSILVTIGLGAAIGIYVESGVHLVAAFGAVSVNAIVFMLQHALVCECGGLFHAAFGE